MPDLHAKAGLSKKNTVIDTSTRNHRMIENYIYFYHTNTFLVIPAFSEQVSDSYGVNFASNTPLSRSAPIYSFVNSGPRSVQIGFTLHREMFFEINYGVSNEKFDELKDDYMDILINRLQGAAAPTYSNATKTVTPPVVAIRMGNDIFIKGVLRQQLGIDYQFPIIKNRLDPNGPGRYATATFQMTVEEIEPYDAVSIMKLGSYRGNLNENLERYALGTPYDRIAGDNAVAYPQVSTPNIDGNPIPSAKLKDPEVQSQLNLNQWANSPSVHAGSGRSFDLPDGHTGSGRSFGMDDASNTQYVWDIYMDKETKYTNIYTNASSGGHSSGGHGF